MASYRWRSRTATSRRRLRQEIASSPARRIPGGHILFQAADIVNADSELRTAGADRRPKRRATTRTTFRLQGSSVNGCRDSGIVDAHLQQEVRRAGVLRPDRPDPGRAAWPQCEHGGHQHQCQPEARRSRCRLILDRSDLGIPYYLAVQTPEPKVNSLNALQTRRSHLAAGERQVVLACSAMARFKRGQVATNSNQNHISRFLRSMPACRAAISAASAGKRHATQDARQRGREKKRTRPGNSARDDRITDAWRSAQMGLRRYVSADDSIEHYRLRLCRRTWHPTML